MNISDLFDATFIVPELSGKTKKQVLDELVKHLARCKGGIDPDELLKVLIEREKLGSTGIGNGIAIPHGKLQGLDTIALVFGKSTAGVEFDSIDGRPVNLIFLLVAPATSAGGHLKALARLSRLLNDKQFRNALSSAKDPQALYDIIEQEESKIPVT